MFIDLVKAFDRVPRELLWDVMLRYGVPPKIVSLLRALHATVQVQFEDPKELPDRASPVRRASRPSRSASSESLVGSLPSPPRKRW